MTIYQELSAVVSPPTTRSSLFDQWDELDRHLGITVPDDYKWLVDTYGPGSFDEFLHVLQPKSRFEPIRIGSFAVKYRERIAAQVASGRKVPFSPDRLQPVAQTEDGDVISWVMVPGITSASWMLTIGNASRTEWLSFEGGIVSFLHAIYVRGLRMPFFPPDFPEGSPAFHLYPSAEEVQALLGLL